jgi:hypothetical protein
MKFHVPSFLIGCVTGAAARSVAPRLRAVALEIATSLYALADAVGTQAARRREDLADLLAEARARARGQDVHASGN